MHVVYFIHSTNACVAFKVIKLVLQRLNPQGRMANLWGFRNRKNKDAAKILAKNKV